MVAQNELAMAKEDAAKANLRLKRAIAMAKEADVATEKQRLKSYQSTTELPTYQSVLYVGSCVDSTKLLPEFDPTNNLLGVRLLDMQLQVSSSSLISHEHTLLSEYEGEDDNDTTNVGDDNDTSLQLPHVIWIDYKSRARP